MEKFSFAPSLTLLINYKVDAFISVIIMCCGKKLFSSSLQRISLRRKIAKTKSTLLFMLVEFLTIFMQVE